MVFFDSHVHNRGMETGGFIIGSEGNAWYERTLHNEEARQLAEENGQYVFVKYVERKNAFEIDRTCCALKYHPQREEFTVDEVVRSIRVKNPRLVVIDTMNEPRWRLYDYWSVCRAFPAVKFLLAHAGGYLAAEFVRLCHLQKNSWLDFSFTHTTLGGISRNPYPGLDDVIRYALKASLSERVLLGSDYPFFDQKVILEYYAALGVDTIEMLNKNFLRLSNAVLQRN